MIPANRLIVIAEMIIFLLLYLGLAIRRKTAEGAQRPRKPYLRFGNPGGRKREIGGAK